MCCSNAAACAGASVTSAATDSTRAPPAATRASCAPQVEGPRGGGRGGACERGSRAAAAGLPCCGGRGAAVRRHLRAACMRREAAGFAARGARRMRWRRRPLNARRMRALTAAASAVASRSSSCGGAGEHGLRMTCAWVAYGRASTHNGAAGRGACRWVRGGAHWAPGGLPHTVLHAL